MSFSWPVRIYWEDTDAGGVVYHARYLAFLERARTEWIRALGFNQTELAAQTGVLMVVRRVECDFIVSARLDDKLTVTVEPGSVRGARFSVSQSIFRECDGETLMNAEVDIASLRADNWRPTRLPAVLVDAIRTDLQGQATVTDLS